MSEYVTFASFSVNSSLNASVLLSSSTPHLVLSNFKSLLVASVVHGIHTYSLPLESFITSPFFTVFSPVLVETVNPSGTGTFTLSASLYGVYFKVPFTFPLYISDTLKL